jgi:hypothetical protein
MDVYDFVRTLRKHKDKKRDFVNHYMCLHTVDHDEYPNYHSRDEWVRLFSEFLADDV